VPDITKSMNCPDQAGLDLTSKYMADCFKLPAGTTNPESIMKSF
jgi:hypothetical protein